MRVAALCTLVMVVALAASPPVLAQQWTCYAIEAGDTAAYVAARITGSADARHQPWFQIIDPARSGFVAKTRYDHVRPGWRACVLRAPVVAKPADTASTPVSDLDPLWLAASLMLLAPFAVYAVDRYLQHRQAVIDAMTRFGEAFVREFERPLIESRAPARALRSRLRFSPHQAQVQVLLAPAGARSYPNLADHRKNVAYDTERVLQALRHPPFVSGAPHQDGDWVVIPFRFQVREQQESVP